MSAPVTVQTSQPVTEPAISGGSALMQVSSALGAILLLILLAGWLFRRLGFAPQSRNGRLLNLRASCQVGQRERMLEVHAIVKGKLLCTPRAHAKQRIIT